jgi:hypothetical protein
VERSSIAFETMQMSQEEKTICLFTMKRRARVRLSHWTWLHLILLLLSTAHSDMMEGHATNF